MDSVTYKQHVHHLLDPVARAIANAPLDDEPATEEEQQPLNEPRQWLENNEPIPHERVMTELGITHEEIENYRAPV